MIYYWISHYISQKKKKTKKKEYWDILLPDAALGATHIKNYRIYIVDDAGPEIQQT